MAMQGKVCIITGASSGIGLATTQALLAAGAHVLAVDMSPKHASLTALASHFIFHQCDLTRQGAPLDIAERAKASFNGRIDALFNVAGIMDRMGSVDVVTDAEWSRVIAVNLTAPMQLMRAVVPTMLEQAKAGAGGAKVGDASQPEDAASVEKKPGPKPYGGCIVNVSSKAGTSGVAGVAYTASKHGLIGVTKQVAFRFKNEGIRCNAIAPGGVNTNILPDPSTLDPFGAMSLGATRAIHTTNDVLEPERVASLLVYLASDASMGINGAVIPIDNAWSAV